MKCALCARRVCGTKDIQETPEFCPLRWQETPGQIARQAFSTNPSHKSLAIAAAHVEAEGYCKWSRVEETMEFARKCGFTKIGIAFCGGLHHEARLLDGILRQNGFEVYSAVCSCGGIRKEEMGIKNEEKVRPGTDEIMCNPVGQAFVLQQAGTEFNVVVGLCVGHDSLFLMHSKAPTTVLVAKDRVLAHNPVGALYTSHGYYKQKLGSHSICDSSDGE